jgi:hypothetical protein
MVCIRTRARSGVRGRPADDHDNRDHDDHDDHDNRDHDDASAYNDHPAAYNDHPTMRWCVHQDRRHMELLGL